MKEQQGESAKSFAATGRVWVLAVGSLVLLGLLEVRLGNLQLWNHAYYADVAEAQRQRASDLMPHRGTVYLSEGRSHSGDDRFPVATNTRAFIAYAVPRDMDNPREVGERLAPALDAFRQRQQARIEDILVRTGQRWQQALLARGDSSPLPSPPPTESSPEERVRVLTEQLIAKFDRQTDPYEPLLRPYEVLDDELTSFLEETKLAGIVLQEEEVRIYPERSLAAHVLGYVGYEEQGRVGRYGIEGHFQQDLAGSLGFLAAERDTTGQFIGIGEQEFRPAQDGDDVVLTIDRVVQSFIEEELKSGVERFGAERGSIVVMNPQTGAIVGMATYPTFDPNYYYAITDPRVQLNPVVSDVFEPGSILKPVVMAAAIEAGKVKPTTTMVDNGPVKVDKYTIDTFDSKHHGVQTMTQVLEQSNNIGMVWVGQQLGAESLYDYFRRFGLGEQTGVSLEGETQTTLTEPAEWNVATVATTSFGQGIAVTPLQVLNAINVLANDGVLMQPHIVAETHRPGQEPVTTEPVAVRHVVSPATAEQLSAMMVSVIEKGVAQLARVPGYYLAGKTGTAQVPDERGKYSPDRKIISFVGYGPVEDPAFSILIKLDNPAGLSFASGTAAPMFRNVAARLLQYYQIPPAYED